MRTETPATSDLITDLVSALKASLLPAPMPTSVSGSPMAMPVTFLEDAVGCSGFLLQVDYYIRMQPQHFPTESSSCISHFPPLCTAAGTLTTSDQLFRLRQGSSLVQEYTIHFCTLAPQRLPLGTQPGDSRCHVLPTMYNQSFTTFSRLPATYNRSSVR
ncbi:hypothetical protein M9458_052467, partial [Cirrhinus mrigala]